MKILGFHIARELPVREVEKIVTVFVPGEPVAFKAWEVDVDFVYGGPRGNMSFPVNEYFLSLAHATKAHPGKAGRSVTLYRIAGDHYRAFSLDPVTLQRRNTKNKALSQGGVNE